MNRRILWAVLLLGIGLIAAPIYFRMFTRAPLGGAMIDEFRPFMNSETISNFADHLELIDRSHGELSQLVEARSLSQSREFLSAWPEINRPFNNFTGVWNFGGVLD